MAVTLGLKGPKPALLTALTLTVYSTNACSPVRLVLSRGSEVDLSSDPGSSENIIWLSSIS